MSQPRIRSIKPETWQDEKIGGLSRDGRLLFVGLITMADDDGRLRAIPSLILGHVFPYDNIVPAKLERWLAEVEAAGLCCRYEVAGVPYLVLTGWRRHQKINRPSPSKLPPPPHEVVTEDSVNGHGAITDGSQPRTRARAGRSDQDQDQLPPQPPASGGSSSPRSSSRANGTNPRTLALVAHIEGLADPNTEHAAAWQSLRAAMERGLGDNEVAWHLHVSRSALAGVDADGTLVIDADGTVRMRYARWMTAVAAQLEVPARLVTDAEHEALKARTAA